MKTSKRRVLKLGWHSVDAETLAEIEVVAKAATKARRAKSRFGFYEYLRAVYRTYRLWDRSEVAGQKARRVARHFRIAWRKETSPIRILVEATFPDAERKQKSRWIRALEFAFVEEIRSSELVDFFQAKGGVAGCAAAAAKWHPKKETDRDDWATPRPRR